MSPDPPIDSIKNRCCPQMLCYTGFTLAELLIALAILGVIATFTIPKILTNQQNAQRNAVLKESVGAVSDILYTGSISGELTENNYMDYFISKLNYRKLCSSNSESQGCWAGVSDSQTTQPGGFFMNGASFTGLDNNGSTGFDYFYVDWNGPTQGPNIEGEDQVQLKLYFVNASTDKMKVVAAPSSLTLYESLFKQ